jgi:hypothetical protein
MREFETRRSSHLALLTAVAAICLLPAARAQDAPASDAERVAELKQTILSRVQRDPVEFRGKKADEQRLKWEWWDKVFNSYVYEKGALLAEISAGEKYELRDRWVYKDMKVTFQDLFQLGAEHDDKLVPIISHAGLLDSAPTATFEGLTLLGKKGEVKGPFERKYKVKMVGGWLATRLEYRDKKGNVKTASGFAYDAITLRWADVKDRTVDDMSEAKALEDLKLKRDAQYPEP